MKRTLLLLLLVGACGGAARPRSAPRLDPALDAELTPYIESYGRTWGDRHKMSGYVLVAQHGQTIYQHAFGFADREHQVVADADTSFRIGSLTKQFTAAAIMVLQQDGKLTTRDTIGMHLSGYPAVGAAVTIRQLLSHTSGIPSYTEIPEIMEARDQPHTVAALMASFDERPLDFTPGSAWAYSNSNYVILGAIIEQVSGMPYAEFMRTRIFEPAGLERTVVGDADGLPDVARGSGFADGALVAAHPIDMSVPFAAGAIRSTANDLVRWDRALAGDRILTGASKQQMYTPVQKSYGYGWMVDELDGHHVLGHGGAIDGFMTAYFRVPDLDLVVVVLSNYEHIEVDDIGRAAITAAAGGHLTAIEEPVAPPLDRVAAARIVGTWQLTEAARATLTAAGLTADQLEAVATITLSIEDDTVVLKPAGQHAVAVTQTSATTYVRPEIGLTIEAALPDDGGPATSLTLTQGGLTLELLPLSSQ
jgi:CubicO group peptidase (beta-lactamase class C family)